ncbi:MAG: hypothetical protein IKL57_00060 [Oscillospiraceae bacterium]|nr:hypothetical protein [Oscillospiraceae bacterium]
MKYIKKVNDEICGKEISDYIGEFSPHRLSFIRFEEDSEFIFDADEEKTVSPYVMKR